MLGDSCGRYPATPPPLPLISHPSPGISSIMPPAARRWWRFFWHSRRIPALMCSAILPPTLCTLLRFSGVFLACPAPHRYELGILGRGFSFFMAFSSEIYCTTPSSPLPIPIPTLITFSSERLRPYDMYCRFSEFLYSSVPAVRSRPVLTGVREEKGFIFS